MSETVAAAPAPEKPAPAGPKASSVAIWSMVLGILSIAAGLSILGGIPAIILGVVGLKKIGNAPDELKGKGMAIAGISAGAVGTQSAPVIVAIMLPAMMQAKDREIQSFMITEMRTISTACQIYAIDNDSQFPPDLSKLFPVYLADAGQLTWTDPKTGDELPYIYVAGANPDSPEIQPILISPSDFRGERVIIYNNGSLERAPAEVAKVLLETLQDN